MSVSQKLESLFSNSSLVLPKMMAAFRLLAKEMDRIEATIGVKNERIDSNNLGYLSGKPAPQKPFPPANIRIRDGQTIETRRDE